jgi:hypothetical protein
MSCKKCASGSKVCGCKDTAYTTPVATTCLPACPPRCSEYMSAACIVLSDGINDLGIHPGETLDSILQRIAMILTNPLCVEYEGGFGVGIGNTLPFAGNGIVEVGIDVPTNIFVTPVVPITAPGGNLNLTLQDQPSNTVFAGPATGPDDTPQFRALVIDDLPNFTTGTSVLMGDGAGKFTNVTIGPNLSFAGGILDADINVVVGADNGLSKNPLNPDEVWLGGTLLQNTTIDGDTNAYSLDIADVSDFTTSANNNNKLTTELGTDKTELDINPSNASLIYTDSASAIESTGLEIGSLYSAMYVSSPFGDAWVEVNEGATDNEVIIHTPKVDGGTAVVNQVLTLKSLTGEAEWENVIASISANEGLIINPLNPNETQLGGPITTPAIFTQDRYIDNDGYILKLESSTGPAQVLELENSSNSSTALKINQLSGDLLGRAIDITSNGTALLIDSQTVGFEIEQRGAASYISTISDAGAVREVLNIRSPYLSSLPVIGYGAQLSFTLNDLLVTGSLQYSSFITSSYTDVTTGTGATKLSLATKNVSDINPVTNLELLGTGQLVLSKYTSLSSFTGVSVGYLGFDASGNIITQAGGGGSTATAAEGLSIGATPGQVELGKSTLSAGADLSTNRFINTGIYDITLSGTQNGTGASVLTVENTAGTTNSIAIRASTNGTSGSAIYGSSSTVAAVGVYGSASTGTAVQGVSNTGAGVVASSTGGIALQSTSSGSLAASLTRNQTNNIVEDVLRIVKLCAGTAATGIGSGIKFTIEDDSGSANTAGGLTYEYTDVTSATRDALFKINVVNGGTELTMIEVGGAQTVRLPQNLPGPYADDTAASAGGVPQYALYIDASSTVKLCQI